MTPMILVAHPRFRVAAAFLPALVLTAVFVNAVLTDSWGDWTTSILIGLGWLAVWIPIQALRPSTRARVGLAVAGLVLVVAELITFVVYTLR